MSTDVPQIEIDLSGDPEAEVVLDMVRRALPFVPILIGLGAAIWGSAGALSTAYALALVLGNFLLSAGTLTLAARIGVGAIMGATMFGFLARLGLLFVAVLVVKDASWFDAWPLGLTIIVTHLGLLFWEMQFVSASLAHPGLKPGEQVRAPSTDSQAHSAQSQGVTST